jgi:chemotaxis protein MotA
MIALLGIIIVIAAVVGGYLLEHGNLLVLFQPAELVIIGGASLGTVFIANPMRTILALVKGIGGVFRGSRYTKDVYMKTLAMMYELFTTTKKKDSAFLEREVDNPKEAPVLSKHPVLIKNPHALHFFCDTLRMHVTGGVTPFDLDQIMEADMAVHHADTNEPVKALQSVGEGLPGLGIVAAVLGVVITMGALGGPPEMIGHKVAAALVGTFLGILLCYGFVGPIAANLTLQNEEEHQYYECLRNGILGFVKGAAPIVAVEQARRTIPLHVRPHFQECEANLKKPATEAAAA